jgi:iron complex transport system substrate-binding protein
MFHEGLENIMRSRPLPTVLSTTVLPTVLAGVLGLSLVGCADEPDAGTDAGSSASSPSEADAAYPVEIESCGHTTTIASRPEHAVTLNQGATEVALALGVEDQMAGTAYLDDAVPEKWQAAYDGVPVLSKEYPKREELVAASPDFVYASYASAFDAKVAGTQDELADEGVASYLSPFGCDDQAQRPQASFDAVWDEVDAVAAAFGVPDRAEELRSEQQATLDQLADEGAGAGVSVLWYDSGRKTPFVGTGTGGPQLVLDAVGADNVFADVEGSWADGSWEDVVAADPDVIVLADASWDSAQDKIAYLEKDPVLSRLAAVREQRFVTVPFSESTAGVRLVDGAASVAEQLDALDLG